LTGRRADLAATSAGIRPLAVPAAVKYSYRSPRTQFGCEDILFVAALLSCSTAPITGASSQWRDSRSPRDQSYSRLAKAKTDTPRAVDLVQRVSSGLVDAAAGAFHPGFSRPHGHRRSEDRQCLCMPRRRSRVQRDLSITQDETGSRSCWPRDLPCARHHGAGRLPGWS